MTFLSRISVPVVSRIAVVLLAVYWLAMFAGTHIPKMGDGLPEIGDKWMHFIGYAGLAFLLKWASRLSARFHTVGSLTMLFVIAVYGAVDELLQVPIPGRYGDIWDWVADVVGAMIGFGLYWALGKVTPDSLRRFVPVRGQSQSESGGKSPL